MASTYPTDDTGLKGLYQRNIGLMSELTLHPITIRALWWGRYRWLERWRIIPNVHYASWRLLWNDRPGGMILFEDSEHPLGPDQIVAIPPRTPVSCQLESPVMHLNINFLLGHPYDSFSSHILTAPLSNQLQEAIRELTAVDPDAGSLDLRQTANLQLLITLLLRDISEPDLRPHPADGRVRLILELLDNEPDLSNAQMAEIVGMSTNGFHRLFKEQVGTTPHDYSLARKMDLACSLLQHTTHTVDVIAEECGFNDRAYLARAFRRRFGMSPSDYRRGQQ